MTDRQCTRSVCSRVDFKKLLKDSESREDRGGQALSELTKTHGGDQAQHRHHSVRRHAEDISADILLFDNQPYYVVTSSDVQS